MSARQYTPSDIDEEITIPERTREDSWQLLDDMARFYFDLSGEELLRRWDAGEYEDRMDEPTMEHVAMFLELIRYEL